MKYGELRAVVLYRTPEGWRFAIYSTVGIMDGRFDLGPDQSLEVAQAAVRDNLRRLFPDDVRSLTWRSEDQPDWWTAEPDAAVTTEAD